MRPWLAHCSPQEPLSNLHQTPIASSFTHSLGALPKPSWNKGHFHNSEGPGRPPIAARHHGEPTPRPRPASLPGAVGSEARTPTASLLQPRLALEVHWTFHPTVGSQGEPGPTPATQEHTGQDPVRSSTLCPPTTRAQHPSWPPTCSPVEGGEVSDPRRGRVASNTPTGSPTPSTAKLLF